MWQRSLLAGLCSAAAGRTARFMGGGFGVDAADTAVLDTVQLSTLSACTAFQRRKAAPVQAGKCCESVKEDKRTRICREE